MSASVGTRLALLEKQVSELRKCVSQTPTQEVAWRLFAAEREMRIAADVEVTRARDALDDQQQALESIIAEMEGLVSFLSGKLPD